jgi:hypothetical protein
LHVTLDKNIHYPCGGCKNSVCVLVIHEWGYNN